MSSSRQSWLKKSTCRDGSCLIALSSTTVGVGRGESDRVVSVHVDSVGSLESSQYAGDDGGTPVPAESCRYGTSS